MAITNEYRITIVNDTSSEKTQAVASNQSNDGAQESKDTKLPKQLGGMAMLGYAKSIVNRAWQTNINTVTLRTGHEELQQKQQLIKNVANRGIDLATSIAVGASSGGAVGAIIGAVVSVASMGIDIAIKQNELNIARGQENTTQFFNQIRIGAGGGRMGRTE